MSHFKVAGRLCIIGAVTLSIFLFVLIAGCGNRGGSSTADTASRPQTGVAARTVTLNVEGMYCGGCAVSVRIALKKLDGVQDAKVDVKKAQAVVDYVEGKVTVEQMVQAVEKVGYKASKPS